MHSQIPNPLWLLLGGLLSCFLQLSNKSGDHILPKQMICPFMSSLAPRFLLQLKMHAALENEAQLSMVNPIVTICQTWSDYYHGSGTFHHHPCSCWQRGLGWGEDQEPTYVEDKAKYRLTKEQKKSKWKGGQKGSSLKADLKLQLKNRVLISTSHTWGIVISLLWKKRPALTWELGSWD